jgi:hypothetical protein
MITEERIGIVAFSVPFKPPLELLQIYTFAISR